MTIFKFGSIRIRLNLVFLLIILIYIYLGFGVEILLVIITVLLHELAHVIVAIKIGVKVREIEIFPFGGVARFDSIVGNNPRIEILVSCAGPALSFILAIIFFVLGRVTNNSFPIDFFMKSNIFMFLFNILPLFPLDGGRIARGYLAYKVGIKSATKKLSYITYIVSIGLLLVSIYKLVFKFEGIYLSLIAIFLFIAAHNERKMAAFIFIQEFAGKKEELKKNKIMETHMLVALKQVRAKDVIECFLPKKYHLIIVIDNHGESIGTINEIQLLEGVIKYGVECNLESLLIKCKK